MTCIKPSPKIKPELTEIKDLSEFRFKLKHYLRVSAKICRSNGLTSLQYQALLHAYNENGEGQAIAAIAEKLQSELPSAETILRHCEKLGLIEIRDSRGPQPKAYLSAKGFQLLRRLMLLHQQELKELIVRFPMSQHGKFCTSPVCWKATD